MAWVGWRGGGRGAHLARGGDGRRRPPADARCPPPPPPRYGAHLADCAPEHALYAFAAQNSIALVDVRQRRVAGLLAGGHTNRSAGVRFAGWLERSLLLPLLTLG